MKNVKATVSDFEGQYSAYSVRTGDGAAYKKPDYDRHVDIGSDVSYALTTAGTQELYGDTLALQVRNQIDGRTWPADIALYRSPVKLVSLALTFNKVSQLMAQQAETGIDPVHQAFMQAAGKQGLQPLCAFFIIPSGILPERTDEDETVRNATTDETIAHLARKPDKVIITADSAEELLNSTHHVALMIEKQKPGFIAANKKLHLVGLYVGATEPVKSLPVPVQDRAPITQITSELRRILG